MIVYYCTRKEKAEKIAEGLNVGYASHNEIFTVVTINKAVYSYAVKCSKEVSFKRIQKLMSLAEGISWGIDNPTK